jgi:hypothetical protein
MASKLFTSLAVLSIGAIATAMIATIPTPTHFTATALLGRDEAKLTWVSREPQVRIFAQKKLLNGTWTSLSRYPRNTVNTGVFVIDTPATHTGSFRFAVKAKRGTDYSQITDYAYLDGMR